MVVGNATSGRSCENTTIFPSVTVALVNDMSRHYMTHSIQMWWGGTSAMMTRARLSYGYRYRSILRRSLASFVVSILRSSNFWGVILECLTLLLGGSHFLQCIRVPVYWGWLLVLGQVDLFWGHRRLWFNVRLEREWDDVPSLCKSFFILDLCVVWGWRNGEGVLFLRDLWFVFGLIGLSSLWDHYTENDKRTLPWVLSIFLLWLKIIKWYLSSSVSVWWQDFPLIFCFHSFYDLEHLPQGKDFLHRLQWSLVPLRRLSNLGVLDWDPISFF